MSDAPTDPDRDGKLQLFHAINDGGASATVRARIDALGLLPRFRFRNVYYPEVLRDLTAHGGAATPAVWDGSRLVSGRDAVLALLMTLDGVVKTE